MVTAESVFPKVGNDPVYASEINRFNPKLIGYVEQYVSENISGTTEYTTAGGTITYPGTGSLQISDFMEARTVCQKTSTGNYNYNYRLRISGEAGLNMVTATKSITDTQAPSFYINHIFTSGAITASGGNVGSPYVISVEGKNNLDGTILGVVSDFTVIGY